MALDLGCSDVAAVRHLLTTEAAPAPVRQAALAVSDLGELARYERPQPVMVAYDQLLLIPASEVIQ